MALQISKTLSNGASGNYWKITFAEITKPQFMATFKLSLFSNQSIADSGAPGLGLDKIYSFPITKDQCTQNILEFGYTNIMIKAVSQVDDGNGNLVNYDPDLVGATTV